MLGAEQRALLVSCAQDPVPVLESCGKDAWPADYLTDSRGVVRHVTVGEGGYPATESLIRQLLAAARPGLRLPRATQLADTTPRSPGQTPEASLGSALAGSRAGLPTAGTRTFRYPAVVPDDQ